MSSIVSRLEKNIVDVIKEEQVKLGYCSEVIRLYYPLQSLNRFMKTLLTAEEMQVLLADQFNEKNKRLGKLEISHKGDRFCFIIPKKIVDQVHDEKEGSAFITEFIGAIQRHGCTIEEIHQIFLKYSKKVHFEKTTHGEFDYLIYFEDGIPDDFRYCITDETCHLIYHRFTPEDYEDFHFE